jgi:uncharacterized RDD family membrane protein YckC
LINENHDIMTDQLLDELNDQEKEYEHAGFWIRVLALFLDFLAMLVPYLILLFLSSILAFDQMLIQALTFILSSCYWVYMTYKHEGTVGKLVLNLRVITQDGEPLSLERSILRFMITWGLSMVLTLISQAIVFQRIELISVLVTLLNTVNSLYGFWILAFCVSVAFMRNKIGFHDKLAKTMVVYNS